MRKRWLLPISSGLLFAFAYPPYNLEFLVWVGFIPLFLFVFVGNKKIIQKGFFAGFIAGFVYFLIVMKWLWSVYPLEWTGVENDFISFTLVGLIWIVSAAGMALWWGLATLAVVKIAQNKKSFTLYFLLLTSSVFTLSEYVRSWFFGLLWAGPGTLWGPHWTLGNLAYIFYNNPLFLKISSFAGIYGITFLIIAANIFILNLLKNSKAKGLIFVFAIIFSLTFIPKLTAKNQSLSSEEKIPVAVIQTKIPSDTDYSSEKQLENFKTQLALLKETSKMNLRPRVLIFPEGTNFFKNLLLFFDAAEIKDFFSKTFKEKTLIIDSSRIADEKGQMKSRVIYLDSKEGALGFYDKRFLTPVGEFLPYPLKFIVNLFSKKAAAAFSTFKEFSKGNAEPNIVEINGLKTGALVCSALYSNNLFRNLSSKNPDFLIVLASTGIFRGAKDIIEQNLAAAKFRAAENKKYLVLAANYGRSYAINDRGNVVKIAENYEPGLFTAEVVLNQNPTWYNKFGDIPVLTLSFLIVFIFLGLPRMGNFNFRL